MKLFFPIDAFYPSQLGGPCNSVYWLAEELCRNEFEVQVFTTTLDIKKGVVEENKYLDKNFGEIYYDNQKNYFKKAKLIYQGIKKNEIIHLNGLFGMHSMLGYFISRFFFPKKTVVLSARGELNKKALVYNGLLKKIVLALYKIFSKNVLFHSTSPEENEDIRNVFGNVKIVELPNYFNPSERISTNNKSKDLLYLGRIHHKKAIHKIIEGLHLSQEFKKSDYRLIIVGKHEERHQDYYDMLVCKIKEFGFEEKVKFIGFKIGKEKEEIYANSYMMMMLSETENFGNVVIESLNQGTPVIASSGTPWEVLPKEKCGYHIDNSPEQIAKTIDEVLTLSEEKYKDMCLNATRLVDENFLIKRKIDNWLKVYNNTYSSQ